MAKKTKRKWNRAHYFARKKSTPRQVGHPVYVYGPSGKLRKYLTFTHNPKDFVNFEEMLHNIDETDNQRCYVKTTYDVSNEDKLRAPDKKYRIHPDDKELIKRLKK